MLPVLISRVLMNLKSVQQQVFSLWDQTRVTGNKFSVDRNSCAHTLWSFLHHPTKRGSISNIKRTLMFSPPLTCTSCWSGVYVIVQLIPNNCSECFQKLSTYSNYLPFAAINLNSWSFGHKSILVDVFWIILMSHNLSFAAHNLPQVT